MSFSKELFSYTTLVHAIAGGLGSVIGMAAFFPLDTVRSRLQLEETRESKNTPTLISDLVKEEGFLTLYRGIIPTLQSLWASNFIYFYTFHGLKRITNGSTAGSAGRDLLLASIAGIVNVLTTTPLWVVNTRLKMAGLDVSNKVKYSGLIDGLRCIYKTEGLNALWSGTFPSLLLVINPALQMASYEAIKRRFEGKIKLNAVSFFIIGAISKAIATVLTYPLQLIQTKLRHGFSDKELPSNAGLLDMTLHILNKQGVLGLYKGLEAKILQTVMTAALMFAVYEKIAQLVFKVLMKKKMS